MNDPPAEAVFNALKRVVDTLRSSPQVKEVNRRLGYIAYTAEPNELEALVGISPGDVETGLSPYLQSMIESLPDLLQNSESTDHAIHALIVSISTTSFLAGINYQQSKGNL